MEESYLDQALRVQEQLKLETDPATRKQNLKMIEDLFELHKKEAKHKRPWHGVWRQVAFWFLVLGAGVWGTLKLGSVYGWGSLYLALGLVVFALLIIGAIVLRVKGHLTEESFLALIKTCTEFFGKLSDLGGVKTPAAMTNDTDTHHLSAGTQKPTLPLPKTDKSDTDPKA